MLTWGQTLLKPYLTGNALFAYWLLFLAFTSGTVAIGLLDFFAVRRFFKSEQARVAQQAQRLAAMRANQHRGGPSPDSHATPSSGSK